MDFEIANMVLNIGKTTQSFDWGNFWTVFLGAGFGALCAYRFNIVQKRNEIKKDRLSTLNKIINFARLFDDKTCMYFKNLEVSKNTNTKLILSIITVDLKESLFLGNYNVYFLYFIDYFNQLYGHLNTIVENYNKLILLEVSNAEISQDIKKLKENNYQLILEDLLILRYINYLFLKHLYITRDRYFGKSYQTEDFLNRIAPQKEFVYRQGIEHLENKCEYINIDYFFINNYTNKINKSCLSCNLYYWFKFIKDNCLSFFAPVEKCPKKFGCKEVNNDP